MSESNDVKNVKPMSEHDGPRWHTLREKRKRDDVSNFETSLNVAQTVRSCGKRLVPSDEIFFDAQRDVVGQNVFSSNVCALDFDVKRSAFCANWAEFDVILVGM
jgi:hypothetical protein